MDTFSLIVKKIIRPENHIFLLHNYDKTDTIDLSYKGAFRMLMNDGGPATYKNKFGFLSFIINDVFYKNKIKDMIVHFSKIQRTYYAFKRLLYLYRFKRAQTVVDQDLELNKITLGEKHVICIYHKNAKYLFKIQDLLKIINTSLLNSQSFFIDPKPIKNPYNNVPFEKSILYHIYNYIYNNSTTYFVATLRSAGLFSKFYKCNFDMTMFTNKYEHELREKNLVDYVNNSPTEILVDEIIKMIRIYNSKQIRDKRKFDIDEAFPKAQLVNIMRPYLLLFIKSLYSLIPMVKVDSSKELNYKLKRFHKFNPKFGEKIYYFKKIYNPELGTLRRVSKHWFNDKHIKFDGNNGTTSTVITFLNDHTSYKYLPHTNEEIFCDSRDFDDFYYNNDSEEESDDDLVVYNSVITNRQANVSLYSDDEEDASIS